MAKNDKKEGAESGLFKAPGQPEYMSDALISSIIPGLGNHLGDAVANVTVSGQNGTGIRITKLDGATPLVFNPVIPVVLTVPSMWDKFPQKQEILRALMETHARNITGIDFSYALETSQVQIGHDGQQMDAPTRTTRSQVNPSATFTEYTGNIIYRFFQDWMFDIQHPDTNASVLPAMGLESPDMPGWTMSAYSMSMLFIQPDPTGLPDRIIDAFVIVNMFPKDIGEIGFQRQLGTTETKERSVNFTGIVQHNNNTKILGVNVMKMLQLHKINYNNALPGLAGSVAATKAISTHLAADTVQGGLNWEANAGNKDGKGQTVKGTTETGAVPKYAYPLGDDGKPNSGTYGAIGPNAATPAGSYSPANASANGQETSDNKGTANAGSGNNATS